MTAKHSEADLQRMAEVHITYEIERLVFVLPIQSQIALTAHPIITQSLLESFLVHLRALADFVAVARKPRHRLDVAAEDYYGGTWPEQPAVLFGTTPETHQANMDELHRRLAHISKHRLEDEDFVWNRAVGEWLPVLVLALRKFIAGLPPERRQWFDRADQMLRRAPIVGAQAGSAPA